MCLNWAIVTRAHVPRQVHGIQSLHLQMSDGLAAFHGPGPSGRLSALLVFLCRSGFYGAFVWARRALNRQKRRFPARAGSARCLGPPTRHRGCPWRSSPSIRRCTGRGRRRQISRLWWLWTIRDSIPTGQCQRLRNLLWIPCRGLRLLWR